VTVVLNVVIASKWKLPTYFGLEGDVTLVEIYRHDVQRAARTSVKVGTIEKDTRVLDELRDDLAILFDTSGSLLTLGFKLPLVTRETLGCFFNAAAVIFVCEMCAVTATPLHELRTRTSEDALAAVSENTRPVAFEKRHVEHPGSLVVLVLETDPLVGVTWY
jgi:hypothetical protein